jgi:hypothetical protein
MFNLRPLFMVCSTAARFLPSKFRLLTIEGENEPLLGEFNKEETWLTDRPFNWLTVKLFTEFGDMFDNASTLIDEILLAGRVLKSDGVMPP